MLRQVFIVRDDSIIFSRHYGKALNDSDLVNVLSEIKQEAFSRLGKEIGSYDFYKYKISFLAEKELGILFIFITGLTDDFPRIKTQIYMLKREFFNIYSDNMTHGLDSSILEVLNPIIDSNHRNLKPKISLMGSSGVGKTTITKLIKAEEIPIEHIPTINGDVSTIKIGKLEYFLWDFAGQDQFAFLWNKFIKGSDAVLIITDSTLENIEKSKLFLELIKEDAPYANTAVIGNKQDLPNALSSDEIEKIIGLKTYSMIANDPENHNKMINIIADVLDITPDVSPLLKPIFEREKLVQEAQRALENGLIEETAEIFNKIADICIELGDDSLAKEFNDKSKRLKIYLKEDTFK